MKKWLTLLCLLLPLTATAQQAQNGESPAPSADTAATGVQTEAVARDNDDPPPTGDEPARAADGDAEDDFVPSQQISEDLSVSFPTDI